MANTAELYERYREIKSRKDEQQRIESEEDAREMSAQQKTILDALESNGVHV